MEVYTWVLNTLFFKVSTLQWSVSASWYISEIQLCLSQGLHWQLPALHQKAEQVSEEQKMVWSELLIMFFSAKLHNLSIKTTWNTKWWPFLSHHVSLSVAFKWWLHKTPARPSSQQGNSSDVPERFWLGSFDGLRPWQQGRLWATVWTKEEKVF